jgi:hypothetical protein
MTTMPRMSIVWRRGIEAGEPEKGVKLDYRGLRLPITSRSSNA